MGGYLAEAPVEDSTHERDLGRAHRDRTHGALEINPPDDAGGLQARAPRQRPAILPPPTRPRHALAKDVSASRTTADVPGPRDLRQFGPLGLVVIGIPTVYVSDIEGMGIRAKGVPVPQIQPKRKLNLEA